MQQHQNTFKLEWTYIIPNENAVSTYYYYYYIRLTAFFQDNLGKPVPERYAILDFTGARDDGVAVASAGPYANHLHLAPYIDNHDSTQSLNFFTGRMPFLSPPSLEQTSSEQW